jgi:hypothetical protein
MKKKLTAIGSSLGFIIDKAIADLYNLDRYSLVEITPKEDGLDLRFINLPAKSLPSGDIVIEAGDALESQKTLKDALGKVNKKYGKALKNLT